MILEIASRPLEMADDFPLTDEQLARLRRIEEYDLWFVIERVEQKGEVAPHLIDEAAREFKKYVALVALGHTDIGMSSPEVDEIWHNFILFTREYGEFCDEVCGRFIHHRPVTSRSPGLSDSSAADFAYAYTKLFGELPAIWRGRGTKCCDTGPGGVSVVNCDPTPGPSCNSSLMKCDTPSPVPDPGPEEPPCDSGS